jgi:hypothetical protein
MVSLDELLGFNDPDTKVLELKIPRKFDGSSRLSGHNATLSQYNLNRGGIAKTPDT